MDIIDFDKEAELMTGTLRGVVSDSMYNVVLKATSDNLLRLAAQAQMTPTSDYDYTDKLRELVNE